MATEPIELTFEEFSDIHVITNLFLYGTKTTPEHYVDRLRSAQEYSDLPTITINNGTKTIPVLLIHVDMKEFMERGPGKNINASQFEFVQDFISGQISLPVGTHTRLTLTAAENPQFSNLDFTESVQQYNIEPNSADYGWRTYIYNSSAYILSDTTRFIVHEDGSRSIENIAVHALEENFDFESGDWWAFFGNALELEGAIDPYTIGRRLQFVMMDKQNVPAIEVYDDAAYEVDQLAYSQIDHSGTISNALAPTQSIIANLKTAGTIEYLTKQGQNVIYGSANADVLIGTSSFSDVKDILVAGDGNDEVDAYRGDDILYGGAGEDILKGSLGRDEVYGELGDDVIYGFSGTKSLFGSGGLEGDLYHGGSEFIEDQSTDGSDTLSYVFVSLGGLTVEASPSVGGDIVIYQSSNASVPAEERKQDVATSIENFILSNDSDTLKLSSSTLGQITRFIGGGGALDKVEFSDSSQGITVDAEDAQEYRTIGSVKFKEFEAITGSNTANDTFKGGKTAIVFDGAGHLSGTPGDVADYSGLLDPSGQSGLPTKGHIVVDMTKDTVSVSANGGRGTHYDTILNVEKFVGTHGNDSFLAKEGLTGITFDGSGGRDAVDFSAFTSGVTVNIDAGTGTVALFNIEEINGSHHDDQLNGSIGNEWFFGNGGADTILAGEGDDFLNGGLGADILGGGSGDDVFYYGGTDTVRDTVFASTGSDTLFLGGALRLTGETPFSRSGGDFIIDGIATVDDPDSLEVIEYSDGARFEVSSLGHTVPFYFPDSFVSGTNLDDPALDGTSGNDIFTWSFGNDVLNGGAGHDIADYTGLGQGIVVTLDGGNAVVQKSLSHQDTLNDIEGLYGTDYGDWFEGDANDNEYVGGLGNDLLFGGGGADILEGGGGLDWIEGEGGNDWVYGGGNGLLFGGDGSDHIYGETGDQVSGGAGEDFLYGTSGAILDGGAGNDFLKGTGGTIYVESTGTDVIAGGGILELTSSSLGSLTFYKAENGSIVLDKGNGDSIIIVSGISTIRVGATDYDYAAVLQAADVKFLKSEYNHVFGGTAGGDTYDSADAGSDTILSAGGNNLYLFDTASFDARTDIYGFIGGTETVVLSDAGSLDAFTLIRNASAPTAFSLYYGAGEIRLQDVSSVTSAYQVKLGLTNITHTLTSLDFVTRGSFLADEIEGDVPGFSFDDVMYGEGGNDEIDGGEGQDMLYGGTGADLLIGGLGHDTLDGG